jgi:hypothetical protein
VVASSPDALDGDEVLLAEAIWALLAWAAEERSKRDLDS